MDVLIDHHLRSDQFAADQRLSIEDIGEEVDTFMFEGFDTTAAAICWTVFLIGNYSHVQSRLYDELQSLPYHSTYDMVTLNQLKYTEACVKEALRLYPSVPLIARRLSKPIRLDDGRQLPDNVTILIYLPGIHQDPVIFPNPTQFEPERFLVNSPDTFSYLPFSAGHRNCIGQKFAMLEVKSMVAHLFRHYHIESLVPIDQIDYAFELVTRPKCPLSVMLIPRSK